MDAFERELVSLQPHLYAFARSLTQSADGADELVQETLERALRKRYQFKPGTNLKAWTFVMMRNVFFSELRRKQVRSKASIDELENSVVGGVSGGQMESCELKEVLFAIAMLPPHIGEALRLIVLEGESYADAAEFVGTAVGTLKSRVFRARESLEKTNPR